jgi:hypothetical protein
MTQANEALEQELAAKAVGRRVTYDQIMGSIKSEHYFTAYQGAVTAARVAASQEEGGSNEGGTEGSEATREVPDELRLLTFCVLVLQNGFTVHGVSACAAKENYNKEIGERIAKENAVNQIWPLLGYELRTILQYEQQLSDQTKEVWTNSDTTGA